MADENLLSQDLSPVSQDPEHWGQMHSESIGVELVPESDRYWAICISNAQNIVAASFSLFSNGFRG